MYWDPFEEMKKIRREMDFMFERLFKREFRLPYKDKELAIRQPLSDIVEKGDDVIVTLEMPGVDKKDIILNITDEYIEVKTEKKEEFRIEKKGLHKYERSYKGYHRVLPLPTKVDADKAIAEYKNGILKIIIPKKEKKLIEKKRILIK